MDSKELKKHIDKYLNGTCTPKEKELFEEFLDSYQGRKFNWSEHLSGSKSEIENNIYSGILTELQKNKSNKVFKLTKKYNKVFKYAAIFLIGLATTTFFIINNSSKEDFSNQIVLELSDGTKKAIDINQSQEITNSKGESLGAQEKYKISYLKKDTLNSNLKLVYNKLYVPYGKKMQIELSDGTLMDLNSGTTVKYPVQFIKGLPRAIFLLDGEGYFKVTKNKEDAFIVHANKINTKVYGTEFNVSSYVNDDKQEIVLVEGSIGVSNNLSIAKNESVLIPNEMASINKENLKITKSAVNVQNYIAWKNGVLLFEKDRFENIIRRLERHYNISIQNNYEGLNDIRFTGTFDIETIEQVLRSFKSYKHFTYERKDDKITINH